MGSKRILLVEDEAVTAMDLKSSLIQLGYDVPAVLTRGEDAIRAAAETRPDLVLMDITLDGPMTGIEAAGEIRNSHAIPVVFLTAHTDAEALDRAKRTEPFGYLPKPCSMEALTSAIEVALYKGEADAQRKAAEQERERLIVELRDALAKVKLLSGLIPICASCKKIRDDRGYWQQIEIYIRDHSDAQFTHGLCPDCVRKYLKTAATL